MQNPDWNILVEGEKTQATPQHYNTMCWSFEVSLMTYSAVLATAGVLLFRRNPRDLHNAVFLSVFGSMQLIDALLWALAQKEDLGTLSCSKENSLLTSTGFGIIMLEPVSSLLGKALYEGRMDWGMLVVYISVFMALPIYLKSYVGPLNGCPPMNFNWTMDWTTCTHIKDHHLFLGLGRDSSGVSEKCWRTFLIAGEFQEEIPLILRLLFLLGITYPYFTMRPKLAAVTHSTILITTWMIGYFSNSHASVWCLANVAQAVVMMLDPCLFPMEPKDCDSGNSKAYDIHPKTRRKRLRLRYSNRFLARKFNRNKVKKSYDAIVVGSGIGGLTAASLLSSRGMSVLVLEQHDRVGGCTHTFTEKGGYFDSGVHYVGWIKLMKTFLSFLAHPTLPVQWESLGAVYDEIVMEKNDLKKPIFYTYPHFERNLCKRFPKDAEGIRNYIQFLKNNTWKVEACLAVSRILGQESPLFQLVDYFFGVRETLRMITSMTAYDVASQFKLSEKVKNVLTGGQMIDHNETPKEVCWFVSGGMMLYYAKGGYYPKGGSQKITETLVAKIRSSGNGDSDVLAQAAVSQILLNDNGEAHGVRVGTGARARDIFSKIIISDAGIYNTYIRLLPMQEDSKTSGNSRDLERETANPVNNDSVYSKLRAIQQKILRTRLSPPQMNGFIILNRPPEDLGLRSENIHSLVGSKYYGYDIDKMIKDTLKYPTDPQALDRTLMTITCPCTKDPEYAKRFPGESNLAILARADPTWFKETAGILAGREYPAEKDAKNIIAEKDEAEKDVANSIAEKDVRRDTAEKDAKKDLAEKDAAATAATDTCAEKKSSVPVEAGRTGHRSAEYEKFKKAWADAFVRRMKMHYPKIKDEHIVSVDVGTPVTAEHYLAAPGGATYGLGWGTKKFSPSLESICQPTTPIKGLYIAGEGAIFGGVVGATAGGLLATRHVLGLRAFVLSVLNNWW